MIGDAVREARTTKGLTQARLARLAGVSRRHLAALEKGANVSINILQRVAGVLELTHIQLGGLVLHSSPTEGAVNVPLLTDTIREARAEADRAQATLARAETLLGLTDEKKISARFPSLPVRNVKPGAASPGDRVHERAEWIRVETAGELRHGHDVDESRKETVSLPASLIEPGEIVFRARGDEMGGEGIADGDLLIVELRPRGRAATGELVIVRVDDQVFVGRWWQKHGRKALLSNGGADVTVGRSTRSMKIVAAINQIVRM